MASAHPTARYRQVVSDRAAVPRGVSLKTEDDRALAAGTVQPSVHPIIRNDIRATHFSSFGYNTAHNSQYDVSPPFSRSTHPPLRQRLRQRQCDSRGSERHNEVVAAAYGRRTARPLLQRP